VTLTATLRDANGNILTGRTVSWSSSNTTVATVAGSGTSATVTGKSNGTATITATSEGKSGTATITVNIPPPPPADNATAAGNTFPASMTAGGIASVTLTMQNSGGSIWNTSTYKLSLTRNALIWRPNFQFLTASVAPGASKAFAFDLRHVEPAVTGTQPAFYQMANGSTLFGQENGRDIFIAPPKGGGAALMALSVPSPATLDPATTDAWIAGALDDGTSKLPITPSALQSNGTVVIEYSYDHAVPRDVDVVLKFSYDPQLIEPLSIQPDAGAAGLVMPAGIGAPGEYWVRATGTVPAGEGLIAGFPFRLRTTRLPKNLTDLGTLTLYYPVP